MGQSRGMDKASEPQRDARNGRRPMPADPAELARALFRQADAHRAAKAKQMPTDQHRVKLSM